MTDFLSHLVERSMASSPIPLPAVAPLFAPGPAITPSPWFGEVEAAEPSPQPLGLTAAATQPDAAGWRFGAAVPARASEPPDRPEPFGAVPSRPRPVDREPAAAQAATDLGRGRARGVEPGAVRVAPATRISSGEGDPQETRRAAHLAVPAIPVLHPFQKARPRLAEARARDGRQADPQPPIVRISIGRIEVRAITPPSPGPPKSAPLPKRSGIVLEEYLRTQGRER